MNMDDNLQAKMDAATSLVQLASMTSGQFKEYYIRAVEDTDLPPEEQKQIVEHMHFLWTVLMAYDIWQRFYDKEHDLCLYLNQEDTILELSKHDLESHVSFCFEIPILGGPVRFTYQDKDTFASKEIAL